MTKHLVRLKITFSRYGGTKAILFPLIEEGQLCDYSIETGEYELTIAVEEVIRNDD